MKKFLCIAIIATLTAGLLFSEGNSEAKSKYPSKPIEMIVPYKAGGGTDNAARIIAEALENELGQPVVIMNKPGAAGEIGFEAIAKAPADGYTIGVLGGPDHSYLPNIKNTNYKLDDFDYLAVFNLSLPILVARKGSFESWEELVEYAKRNPEAVTIGCSGGGPTTEAAIAMSCGDFKGTIVKFSGSADVSSALLGGHIDLACLTPSYLPTLEANGCKPLIYFSEGKISGYEYIPSLREKGFDVNMAHNPIFCVPSATPSDIKNVLKTAMGNISMKAGIKEKFEKLNTFYDYKSGDELNNYLTDMDILISDMVGKYGELFK